MKDEKKTTADKAIEEAIEEVTKLGNYLAPREGAEQSASAVARAADSAELTLDRLGKLAKRLVDDGAVPRDMKAGHVLMAMQAGIDHGLSWLGGIQGSVVINGNFSWRGVAAAALIRNSPVCKPGTLRFWSDDKGEGGMARGVATAWRVGYLEPDTRIFTWDDARRAELVSGKNWKQYPDRMLMWRALGLLARDIFSDVLGGFPLAEEAMDFDGPKQAARTVGRAEAPPPSAPDPLLDAIEGKTTAPGIIVSDTTAIQDAAEVCEHGNVEDGPGGRPS